VGIIAYDHLDGIRQRREQWFRNLMSRAPLHCQNAICDELNAAVGIDMDESKLSPCEIDNLRNGQKWATLSAGE
jgi:hypothetical protein